jgi:hypothetical protein
MPTLVIRTDPYHLDHPEAMGGAVTAARLRA